MGIGDILADIPNQLGFGRCPKQPQNIQILPQRHNSVCILLVQVMSNARKVLCECSVSYHTNIDSVW